MTLENFEKFAETINNTLPPIATSHDIVKSGLVQSSAMLSKMRINGTGPSYMKIGLGGYK